MPRLPLALLLSALALPGLAHADDLMIEGVGIGRDVECEGRDVGVYGAENTVVLTGRCGRIVVHGVGHKVSFEEGTLLAVSGADNTVTGGRARDVSVAVSQNTVSATLRGADAPARLEATGAKHRIAVVLAGPSRLAVAGSEHLVEWSRAEGAPNPDVSATGVKNVLRRKP